MSGRRTTTRTASRVWQPGSRHVHGWPAALLVPVAAGLLGGCAATAPKPAVDATTATPKVSSRVRAEEAAIHRQVQTSLHHDSDAHTRYGTLPTDLRSRQRAPANQTLSATTTHPAEAIQGNGVMLHLPTGASALATAVGPDVPDRIQGSADLHTPATWKLTFDDVRGSVPLARSMFTITDEQGMLLSPRVSVVGGGPLPKVVPPGRPLTLQLTTIVSVGDGKLRYAPAGRSWLAEWDFDVETD